MFKKSKLLLKFLYTYLLVAVLILGIMLAVLRAVINIQLDSLERSQNAQLELLTEELQNQFFQYKELATLLSMDSKMSRSWIALSHYNAIEAISELKKYKAKCINTDEILLWFAGDSLYTSSGYMEVSTYVGNTYPMEESSKQAFLQCFANQRADTCVIRCQQDKTHSTKMYYHCPIPVNDANPSAAVGFLLDASAYEEKLCVLLDGNDGYACLSLANGEVVAQFGNSALMDAAMRVLDDGGFSSASFRDNHTDYQYQCLNMDTLGLKYHIITNTRQVMEPVNRIWRLVLLVIITVFFLSVVISYLLSLYNYRPIHFLCNGIVSLPKEGNELDAIQKVLQIATNENLSLHNMVDDSHYLIREQALRLLFEGDDRDEIAARRMLEFISMESLSDKLYAVAVVDAELQNLQNVAMSPHWPLHFFLKFNDRNVLCVALSAEDSQTAMVQLEAETMRIRSVMGEDGLRVRIGVGQAYDLHGRVRRSMNEAMAALDQCAPGETAFFAKLTNMQLVEGGFDEQTRRLLADSIKSKNADVMCQRLSDMTRELRTGMYSDEMRCFLLYDLVHIVLNSLIEMGLDRQYIDDLMHVNTSMPEQFEIDMRALFLRIAQGQNEERPNMRLYRIMTFLRENFQDSSLTVENVAARFNMTRSYLSRLFREETGGTYIEFVSSLRIQEAKKMLRETEIPIQKILESVGYHDVASFHRKFKQMTGMTPATYRDSSNKGAS